MAVELVTVEQVRNHYDFLNTCGFLGEGKGFLRPAYSDLETKAMDYFGQWAEARGAITEWDPVRNKIITFNPDSKPADCYIEFISHLDTVPSGGNFDGAAGIVAGVLAAEKLIKEKILPKGIGVRVRIYRGEESGTFGVAYIGSLAAAGLLDPVHLDKSFGGQKLLDAMKSQKVDLSYITQRRPAILTEQIDTILYSDELHIEQGPILIDSGLDIGVVTSIRGAIRAFYNFTGETAHSGTTPLHLRKDAISALGPIINEFNQFLSDRLTEFPPDQNPAWDLIATITEVKGGVGPSSVGGESSMRIDLRGIDTNYMNESVEELSRRLKAITSKLNLGFVSCELSRTQPVTSLDSKLQIAKVQAANDLSLSCLKMPSGAGHDSAVVANLKRSDVSTIPVGMSFVPNKGLSHSPTEHATLESISAGATHMIQSAANYVRAVY